MILPARLFFVQAQANMVGPTEHELRRKGMMESQLWHMIRMAAANDPILKDMLDQCVTYFHLKYNDNYKSKKN